MAGITLQEVGGDLVIPVLNESTVIGRGQFLQVTDKRVSRSHALLEMTDGKLYITPTHTNPCFLRSHSSKEQKVLARDARQLLEHGDEFGLLPDQLFYKVSYPQINGKDRGEGSASEDNTSRRDESVSNGQVQEASDKDSEASQEAPQAVGDKKVVDQPDEKVTPDEQDKKVTPDVPDEEMAKPVDKKRPLPDWMLKAADTKPAHTKPAAKKKSVTKHEVEEEEEEEDSKGRETKESEEDYEVSDDDYVPEKSSRRGKRKASEESEEDVSDDDYSPRARKASKGRRKPVKTPARKTRRRGKNQSDEELPRRKAGLEESPTRRPQRAARQKRGSYVDDPMIEEALEDFASDNDDDGNEDKDSDFEVEGEEDSGSDWEKSKSQKPKPSRASRSKGPPRGATKKGKKRSSRRASSTREDSYGEDVMEDDEPYVPRPSKRRAGTRDSDDSEDGNKKKRKREPCQYGQKCYRKNPVHFRTYCHPGDSSFDEEEQEESCKESSKKDSSKVGQEKPSRPQRSTAGTRLVTHDLPDGGQLSDQSPQDSNEEEDDLADGKKTKCVDQD
ncbi:aprataxin and PNK-like factor [Physella acuta]|uniref:aprataxin and PNK-like factor n=1 Tax=Physella acuta TaxID=109671 RepID=UPI0027DBCB54|nr:aprataxin and PNK-like factor [Physella acuta]